MSLKFQIPRFTPLGANLPSGVLGSTLYNNGTAWVSGTLLYNNGTAIGINTNTPSELLTLAGNLMLGVGATATSAVSRGIFTPNGSGTNVTTGNLQYSTGLATGNAPAGNHVWTGSTPGSSGTATQVSLTLMTLNGSTGNLGLGGVASSTQRLYITGGTITLDDTASVTSRTEVRSSSSVAGNGGLWLNQGSIYGYKFWTQGTGGLGGNLVLDYIVNSSGAQQTVSLMQWNGNGQVTIGDLTALLGPGHDRGLAIRSLAGTGDSALQLIRTAISSGSVGMIDSYNGSTLVSQVNFVADAATDAGYMSFSAKASGVAIAERFRVSSSGVTVTGTGTITGAGSFGGTLTISTGGVTITGNSSIAGELALSGTTALGLSLAPYGTLAGNTKELRFLELVANGTNYVGFKAADSLVGNVIWTLPSADGSVDQVLKTSGSGVLSWASPILTITAGTGISSTGGSSPTLSINQAFTPTWTGAHIFAPSSDVTGVTIRRGIDTTPTADVLKITSSGGGTTYFRINASDGDTVINTATLVGSVLHGTSPNRILTGVSDFAGKKEFEIKNQDSNVKAVRFTSASIRIGSDEGTGVTAMITLTNAENTATARSTGVGTIKFADATNRDNSGFIKIYIGTVAFYLPVFAAN